MKKYEIKRHGNLYKIYERATKQYVACSTKRTKIKARMDDFEGGAGFAGHTPSFVMNGLRYGLELDRKSQYLTDDQMWQMSAEN